ncbi:hypothetical protein ACIO93_35820 [Streptomyces sp. NPDC087903]|uniref:hypothetical protein n=1 Tax=Streptomyces sp. NPDC087903 TaxID=3365819 RepID=UPI0037F81BE5
MAVLDQEIRDVADAVMAALRGKGPAVDGRLNAVQTLFFGRLLSSRTAVWIGARFMRGAALGG